MEHRGRGRRGGDRGRVGGRSEGRGDRASTRGDFGARGGRGFFGGGGDRGSRVAVGGGRGPEMKQSTRQKLCNKYREGAKCKQGDPCWERFDHVDCTKSECKPNPADKCLFGHPWKGISVTGNESNSCAFDVSMDGNESDESDIDVILQSFEPSNDEDDLSSSPQLKSFPCASGGRCWNERCTFWHPPDRMVCPESDSCVNFYCAQNHPFSRLRPCKSGLSCWNCDCKFLHPVNWSPCSKGALCVDVSCEDAHPYSRTPICAQSTTCVNYHCTYLHPDEWDPDPPVEVNNEPVKICSPDSASSSQQRSDKKSKSRKHQLKSLGMREADRQKNPLPIFSKKNAICQRLREEHVLVVTASTGSGKTTQIPQYCAEEFGGVVACTQPRVIAAISISNRIALEYDGSSVGNSVGYSVGGGNLVRGNEIMLMTDSALVQLSQNDRLLSKIRVLMIDEAHERNLNTDIVLGIAKDILEKRRDDFFVIIASATIDPKPFLDFFSSDRQVLSTSLDVPGRIFDVSIEYKPPKQNLSSKRLILEHVIPSLLEAIGNYKEGHVLVFLPGQREIEQAVKAFVSQDIPECVALPLFGSLPPEEQDKIMQFDRNFAGTGQRMIVFCTNIAETSLTIAGVKLVIDLGLANEVRYDQQRRLKIIELVQISRSSADQRKGRAGRICAGHCIRLYNEGDLVRENIEPEILRSSLDTVVLQLVRLNFNPTNFYFMTTPSVESLQGSIDLLLLLQCIEKNSDGSFKITPLGKLFSALPFDPRLSAFVVTCHQEFSKLKLASVIAAILSAPGNIYFMGGPNKQAKAEARQRISIRASKFDSDLLCMASVFECWDQSGVVDANGRCVSCTKAYSLKRARGGCRSCRVKFSNEEGLNNKVLDFVLSTSENVRNIVLRSEILSNTEIMAGVGDGNVDDVTAVACLQRYFMEQCGQVLVPAYPQDGVRLTNNDVRGRITNSSCFLQKVRSEPFHNFVAMNIACLSSGEFIVEQLHPIPCPAETQSLPMPVVFRRGNLSNQVFKSLQKWTSQQLSRDLWYWAVCTYDPSTQSFSVHNKQEFADDCYKEISNKVQSLTYELVNEQATEIIANGAIEAVFRGGMELISIQPVGATWRISFQNIPIQAFQEFRGWIVHTLNAGVHPSAIRFAYASKSESDTWNGYAVFTSETATSKVLQAAKKYIRTSEEEIGDTDDLISPSEFQNSNTQTQKLTTIIKTQIGNPALVQQKLSDQGVKVVTIVQQTQTSANIYIRNFPMRISDVDNFFTNLLQNISQLQGQNVQLKITAQPPKVVGDDCRGILLNFKNISHRDIVAAELKTCFSSSSLQTSVSYTNKHGKYKQKIVHPDAVFDVRKDVVGSYKMQLTFSDADKLQAFFTSSLCFLLGDFSAQMFPPSEFVKIKYPHLFDLGDFMEKIEEKHKVKVERKDEQRGEVKLVVSQGSMSGIAGAVSALKALVAPIVLFAKTEKQKSFYREVKNNDEVSKNLNLHIDWSVKGKVEVHGPRSDQGEFMRRLGDYFDEFEQRYVTIPLFPTTNSLVGKEKAGEAKLKEFAQNWKDRCLLKHMYLSSELVIQFLATHDTATPNLKPVMDKFFNELEAMLSSLGVHGAIVSQSCAYCGTKSPHISGKFSICGHGYCRTCIFENIFGGNTNKLDCPICKTPISVKDLKVILTAEQFLQLCNLIVRRNIEKHPEQFDVRLCPNTVQGCNGVISKNMPADGSLPRCFSCNLQVCLNCNIVCDVGHAHIGQSCEEYKSAEVERQQLDSKLLDIVERGKQFVTDNWPVDLPKVENICWNPGLRTGSESLSRFQLALTKVSDGINNGFFAWHGTSENVIEKICDTGFDPTKRRGQVYGEGEYFGVDASVSRGYSRGCNHLIVAYILQSPAVRVVQGFCYVVNNPTNWEFSYCLPLLVVSFGPGSNSPFFVNQSPLPSAAACPKQPSQPLFRWHWKHDNGSFEPYRDELSTMFEQAFSSWKENGGDPIYITPPIVRYIDDIPAIYKIDFVNNVQINARTQFRRKIERTAVITSTNGMGRWEYKNEAGIWRGYDDFVQEAIEEKYREYLEGKTNKVVLNIPGRPEQYEIDFVRQIQTNQQSATPKPIRRVDCA